MRILALSSLPPQPLNHAVRRIVWNLLTRLPDDVHLITWRTSDVTDEDVDKVGERLPLTTVLPARDIPLDRASRLRRQARFLAGGPPPYVQAVLEERDFADEGGRRRFAAFVDDLNHRGRFDAVVAFEEVMTAVPLPIMDVPLVVHRLNLLTEVLAAQRGKDVTGRLFWPLERRGWERYDRDTMRNASLAITNTEEVAQALSTRYPQTPTVALPSGTDLRQLARRPSSGKDAIFVGWMSYEPNLDAATWFAQEVWPQVRSRHPDAIFRIVGRDPGAAALALHRPDEGVVVTGEVPDIADAAEGCRVGVVPLRRGRGMKTKTIELMALGLPVVSLPAGREGISAAPAEGLLAPTGASEMAKEIIDLLDHPDRADALGAIARDWVIGHHSWDAIAARYRELLVGVAR